MPNAFTPSGIYNVFRIPPGTSLDLSNFSIYDRWGNCIFTTSDITKGWDGKYKGKSYNTGVFAYMISGTYNGNKVFMQGSFTLIR
jgi:gliding motility-associated-like protein